MYVLVILFVLLFVVDLLRRIRQEHFFSDKSDAPYKGIQDRLAIALRCLALVVAVAFVYLYLVVEAEASQVRGLYFIFLGLLCLTSCVDHYFERLGLSRLTPSSEIGRAKRQKRLRWLALRLALITIVSLLLLARGFYLLLVL